MKSFNNNYIYIILFDNFILESPLPPYTELAVSEDEDSQTHMQIPTHVQLPYTPPHTPLMVYKDLGSTCSPASYSTSSSSSSTSSSISGTTLKIYQENRRFQLDIHRYT